MVLLDLRTGRRREMSAETQGYIADLGFTPDEER